MAYRGLAVTLHVWVVAKSASTTGLTTLPSDIGAQAAGAAFNYAWYATNSRMGPSGDVAKNKLDAEAAIAEMKKLGKGLLADSVVDDFMWMSFNAGWCAANRRHGTTIGNQPLLDQANQNEKQMNEHASKLQQAGVFDIDLVTNLKWMAWRASWYAANTRDTHFPEQAKTDWTYYVHYSDVIKGEVKLLSIDFDTKAAEAAAQKPLVVGHQVLDNSKSSTQQSMTVSYSYTQGHTDSWSNTVGFKINIAQKIKAGFIFAAEETTVSFEASYQHTWSGGSSEGETKQYTFPLIVPAHAIYQAKATVHQSNMNVPYKLTMSIGSYTWTSSGTWYGVAVSQSTYRVEDITPNGTVQDLSTARAMLV
eukprot:TRINITY_DN49575_c0_g1_i1.p1 TRINITY_DN49575_c0_g1~~TRINITY_DN49575_c0_g1_i1.p1  ORF type:complete len:363 (-),score=55.16 TRINITY_DN49575_c0_g1_i1:94-1182(-)